MPTKTRTTVFFFRPRKEEERFSSSSLSMESLERKTSRIQDVCAETKTRERERDLQVEQVRTQISLDLC